MSFRFRKRLYIATNSAIAVLAVIFIVGFIQHVLAYNAWVQSDWSGGVGSSTTNQYSSDTNLNTSTANQVTLNNAANVFSNNSFSANLSNWSTGMAPDLISGLKVWFKADAITGVTNGGNVNTWSDSSGNGYNATAGVPGTYETNIVNGLPAVDLNGYNDYYTFSPGASITTNNMTVFALHIPASSTQYGMLLSSNGVDDEEIDMNYPTVGEIGTYLTRTIGNPYGFTGGTPLISTLDSSNSSAVPYDNGTPKGSGAPDSATPSTFHIGNYAFGSGYYYTGSLAELIIYNTALSNTQRAAVEDYLASKYGVAVSSGVTATYNTGTTYDSDAGSAKLVANDTGDFSQNVTTTNGVKYALSGYVYTNGSAVTSSQAQLYFNGSAQTTTYTSVGGGWYQLNAEVTGTGTSAPAGVQVVGGNTAYLDGMSMDIYQTSGTLVSNIYNAGVAENWGNLTDSVSIPANTAVSVLVRSGNQPNLSDAPAFTSCSPITPGSAITSSCAPNKTQYVQYELEFTSDGSASPTFNSITIPYTPSDVTPPPVNASNIALYDGSSGPSVSSNGWANTDPYFTWTAGQDNTGGSGILGYCLYLGQDPTGDPITTKGYLGTSPVNTDGACQFAVSATDIDTSIAGYLGTALSASTIPYYLNIKAIDNADNVYNGSSEQFEFVYDNLPPTNPAFITAPSEFVSNDQVTLTWPTTGSDAASDAISGVAGLQYRIGSSGIWYGANHNGNQDMTDLLPNNGSYTTVSNPDFSNLVQGNNIIYFRTWNNAGDVSSAYVTTVIKINTTAPSSPQNLVASPSINTSNSFAFSWLPPATFTGSSSNITYCYTVNVLPNSGNCTYTAAGVTSLPAGAFATEPGDNTFYLVAKDEAGNINYATAASETFTANTPAPGIPLNLDIADISVKATSTWKLAISWEPPSDVGAGVATYKIYRSTDGANYSNIASTAGTSYVDSNLNQQDYYYKVEACDSANNCGAQTSVVSLLPTGKFTSPANLISGPSVVMSTRTATITWTTDRDSNSSIEYGLSSNHYYSNDVSNNDQSTSHSVTLSSLTAGTTYYYRAQWTDTDGNEGTSAEGVFTTLPAPTVSNVSASGINLTSATIQFTTHNATAVQLQYSGGSISQTQTLNTSTNTSTYNFPFNGLSPGTTYTYRINPFDTSGNVYDNPTSFSFTTPPQPTITNVEFEPVSGALSGTEQISWTTNVPASSQISYGLLNGARQTQINTTLTMNHTMTISELSYNTQYSITATSVDSLGNVANSDLQVFKSGIDTRPPIISDVSIQPSIVGSGASAKGQLIVSWRTDKTGTSQVQYGNGGSGEYTTKTTEDAALVTNHVVVISGLSTSQVYHVQAISKDADGVKGVSADQTSIIGQASDNALSIVFNALQSIFGL